MSIPNVRVEVAFGSQPGDATQVWTDVTPYVLLSQGVSITRGRSDEFAQVQPSTCSLTLDNSDGRFTAGRAASPYYPNVKIGRKLRVFVGNTSYNVLTGDSAGFEGGTLGDWFADSGILWPTTTTVANSATRAHDGSRSMLVTWGTGAAQSGAASLTFVPTTAGVQNTISAWVWVPTGSPRVSLGNKGTTFATATTTKDAWQRLSWTFTAAGSLTSVWLFNADASTAGNTVYVDSIMVNVGASADPFVGDPTPRFTGYVDEWPVEWAPGARWAQATVTAVDEFKRLGQVGEFSNVVSEEIRSDSPTAYYALGEPEGSTAAGDTSGLGQPNALVSSYGTGGSITFGTGIGPGSDGLPAAIFSPISASAGQFLTAKPTMSGGLGLTLRAAVLTSTAAKQTIVRSSDPLGTSYVELRVTAAGKLEVAQGNKWLGLTETTVTSSVSINDGLTHDVVATITTSGLITLYLDGTSVGTASGAGTGGNYAVLNIGGSPDGQIFAGTLSHVASYNQALTSARVAQHWLGVNAGFAGESSGSRIGRYARWAGVVSTSFDTGASASIAAIDTTGAAPVQAMQDVADTEGGVLFVAGNGTLTFHARSHRFNAAIKATLTGDDIGVDSSFKVNDAFLVNDFTANRDGGITFRAVNSASIADYGRYRKSITLLTTSDGEVVDAANWNANRLAQPAPRLPSLSVDLLTNTPLQATVPALEIGDQITVSGLPSQAPASSLNLFLEGWSETVSTQDWTVTFNASPALLSNVFVLDDPTYGALDAYPLAY